MQKGKYELRRVSALIALVLVAALARAEEVQHLRVTVPGGMPGLPIMTGIQHTNNIAKLTWDGPSGYYQLYEKLGLTSPTWQKFGSPNLNRTTNITTLRSNAFFRVLGPSPQYAGASACLECHESVHAVELQTKHAEAFQALKRVQQENNASCLPCHTVGYGLPTGFVSEPTTPQLAGVQCENCHGPAGNHAANPGDLTARPRTDIAAQVCGGCHSGSRTPTFNEWSASGHAVVTEDMNLPNRINSCGRCHSGTARLAMVAGVPANVISTTLTNDANVAITCAVCHDPHQNHVWTNVLTGVVATNQLRYPDASTNYYSLSTTAPFTNRYDINVCAQCHNDRGAAWTTTSRPPHHSPQYNMLLGTVGIRPDGTTGTTNAQPAAHATLIAKQCVGCHMPTEEYASETQPAATGHSFRVIAYESCLACHPQPEALVEFTQDFAIKPRIQQLKTALDLWGTTESPLVLRTNYGAMAWEYTNPGELSTGPKGPTDAEQKLIPDAIKQARFNLYVVNYDGSYGVHNALYALELLDTAYAWVLQSLYE